jgi:ankyrin repeat protein
LLNFDPAAAQKSIRALINATIRGNIYSILLLLNYGIDPNQIELINGTGPLHEAVRYNDFEDEVTRQERLKIVKYLANFGANPDLVNLRNEVGLNICKIG